MRQSQKFVVIGLIVLLVAALLPGIAAAQDGSAGYAITVRLWQGADPWPGRYLIGDTTGVTLYYLWFAATDEQVLDFINHAQFDITLDGESLFETPEEAALYWQEIGPFSFAGRTVRQASWLLELPEMEPGEYVIETVISLDAAVEDGIAGAPFEEGVLHETTNIITVVATEAEDEPADAVETDTGNTDTSTVPSAPAVSVPTLPAVPVATVAPTVPAEAPRETWVPREATYAGRVVGTFVVNSPAHWYPAEGNLVQPSIVFKPGQSLWVYGMDPTRQFYMVILDEAYIWVRAGTIGPTNDPSWHGTPLPSVIIDPNS